MVCVLNWGLGHATRCMPIINQLCVEDVDVWIASDGDALLLLKEEYPQLQTLELPPYQIEYSGKGMVQDMAFQMPKILSAIRKEKKILAKYIDQYQFDAVISDNRYGCYSKKTKTVFLTHQINILIPWKWLQFIVRKFNKRFIQKFDECWVPDIEGKQNLSGVLSQGLDRVKFIGVLSRMTKLRVPQKYEILVVLSGPEPQRTYLEKRLCEDLQSLNKRVILVAGKPQEGKGNTMISNIERIPYLTSKTLNQYMSASKIIISRSGYSTIMDLAKLGKQAILIPTPGQTEQEYLAQRFYDQKVFLYQKQDAVDILKALEVIDAYTGVDKSINNQILISTISCFLNEL